MNTISKFHQSHKYTDSKMGITVEFHFSIIKNRLIGKMKTTHPMFPTIESVMDGMKPETIQDYEKDLLKQQSENKIKNLEFGRQICVSEVNDRCVEIPVS